MRARGLGVAAISYDPVAVLKSFADREHIEFPLLSDSDSQVIRRFGIFNEAVPKSSPAYGIPHPGTYVVDAHGVVTGKYFEDDYRVRDTAASILLRQFGLAPEREEAVAARHVKLRVAGAGEPVRPAQRISLSVDVEMPAGVHVYAPGVRGYIPISLTLDASPAYRTDPPTYPPSKTLHMPAIHETVPVFEGRVRIVQMVTLANAGDVEKLLDAGRNLAIRGQFRYQACNARECFPPETVPVEWSVNVLAFDRTRAPEAVRRK